MRNFFRNRIAKVLSLIAALILVTFTAAACTSGGTNSGAAVESNQQGQDTTTLENNQPLPHFNYSQYRQTIIDAETAEANGTQTTSFFFQMGALNPVYSCPSLGIPVSNTASLSNPLQTDPNGYDGSVIAQEDPNGVYTPQSSTGTFVICLGAGGTKYLFYWEGDVMNVGGAASWDTATHTIKVDGAPTATIHTSTGK